MSLCENCFKGITHEGIPSGKTEIINGINCYIAIPSGDYAKNKTLLYLPDVLGWSFVNCRLMADDFAANGFKTVIPDYFYGEEWAPDTGFSKISSQIPAWLSRHKQEITRPILDKVVAGLKDSGVTTFAAVGYCFGGRYVFDLGIDNIIKVGATAHPSLLKVPDDLEEYASSSKAALLLNTCTFDHAFPEEAASKADEIFRDFTSGYKREHFKGLEHGFAVRGDMSNEKVKAGKEGSFKSVVLWLKEKF